MTTTVVLIGNFFGELNLLKEALGKAGSDLRCLSFTNHETALNLLLKDHVLKTDYILCDEDVPASALPLLRTVESPDRTTDATLILFLRANNERAKIHPALKIHLLRASPDKNDYHTFLRNVMQARINSCFWSVKLPYTPAQSRDAS
jgi:hypothetical protein